MIEGTRIALYNINGQFYATQNHCTHKGAQLVHGSLDGSVIECGQHGWKFDVKTGKCLAPSHGRALKQYPVSIEQSSVVIELPDGGAPKTTRPCAQIPAASSTGTIQFHAVAGTGELEEDDDVLGVVVGETEIAIYRVDGEFYATHGLCTHECVKLADGYVEEGRIECPLHSACFDIKTGKVLAPPAEVDLKTYPVKVEGDTIYVGIEAG